MNEDLRNSLWNSYLLCYNTDVFGCRDFFIRIVRENHKQLWLNYYKLPLDELPNVKEASSKVKEYFLLHDNSFKMSAMSKIALLKINEDIANKVYPDKRKITKYSNYVAGQIEKYILRSIKYRRFTTKDEVIIHTNINLKFVKAEEYGYTKDNKKQIISREFDRNINSIIKKYTLLYKKANKELKDRFKLKGYITIICKND